MNGLYWLITVSDRHNAPRFAAFYQRCGVETALLTVGQGTAASEMLDYFGMEKREKALSFAVVTHAVWRRAKQGLQKEMMIDVPGTGIAFTVPLSSIGGKNQLAFLTAGQDFAIGEESTLKDTKYELLVTVANQGYTELVMDAARGAGAGGGTVIHAKGTGMERAEQFLGVSLVSEKEVLFIVVKREAKNAVMRAIMDKAGLNSKAGALVFSLPVTDTAGLRLAETDEAAQ